MKYFSLIEKEEISVAPETKVVPAEQFSTLLEANELLKKAKKDARRYREKAKKEAEGIKEDAKEKGFEEGLKKWNEEIIALENEIKKVRKETENLLLPLSLAAVKKIIGRELETKPETVVDIISTALKTVSQHRRIALYVNPSDLDLVEKNRPALKALFENLESLTIQPREDVKEGGTVIETEAGIINAQLENQLNALEAAFRTFFKNHRGG